MCGKTWSCEGAMNVAAALIAGVGLGLTYFGGLWLTVRTVGAAGAPSWIPLSFAARLAALALGLWALCGHGANAAGLIAALFGVWLARGGMLWWLARGGHSHAA